MGLGISLRAPLIHVVSAHRKCLPQQTSVCAGRRRLRSPCFGQRWKLEVLGSEVFELLAGFCVQASGPNSKPEFLGNSDVERWQIILQTWTRSTVLCVAWFPNLGFFFHLQAARRPMLQHGASSPVYAWSPPVPWVGRQRVRVHGLHQPPKPAAGLMIGLIRCMLPDASPRYRQNFRSCRTSSYMTAAQKPFLKMHLLLLGRRAHS